MRSPTRRTRSTSGRSSGSRPIARAISRAVCPSTISLRIAATAVSVSWLVPSSTFTRTCLQRTFAHHEDEAGKAIVDRHEVDPADVGRGRLGRRGKAGIAGQRGDRRRREAEPVLAGELHLAELVPDHELLDLRHERGIDDRFDVPAVALVGRDAAGRGVWVRQQARQLQLGEDVANGRARHAEARTAPRGHGCPRESRK